MGESGTHLGVEVFLHSLNVVVAASQLVATLSGIVDTNQQRLHLAGALQSDWFQTPNIRIRQQRID